MALVYYAMTRLALPGDRRPLLSVHTCCIRCLPHFSSFVLSLSLYPPDPHRHILSVFGAPFATLLIVVLFLATVDHACL